MIKIITFPKHNQKAVEKESNITKNKKSMSTLSPSSADSLVAAHFLKPTVIVMRQEQCSVWLPKTCICSSRSGQKPGTHKDLGTQILKYYVTAFYLFFDKM